MADDVDATHEMSIEIDCRGADDAVLHCAETIIGRAYIPSVAGGSTWVAEADGLPFAVVVRGPNDTVTVTRAQRDVAVADGTLALFFSYHLRRDPTELLSEIHAGLRPRR